MAMLSLAQDASDKYAGYLYQKTIKRIKIMELNIVRGILFGTDIIIDNKRKHTYGYHFKNVYKPNGEFSLWFQIMVYLIKHKNGVPSSKMYEYMRFCNKKCIERKSNHDLLTALKNCGFVSHFRVGKITYWKIEDKGVNHLKDML